MGTKRPLKVAPRVMPRSFAAVQASHGSAGATRAAGHASTGRIILSPDLGSISSKHCILNCVKGRPIRFFMSARQVSDYTGAAALLGSLPEAEWLLADRGYDADWLREVDKDKGINVWILGRVSRKNAVKYDKRQHKRGNRIEIMFGHLKDWRAPRFLTLSGRGSRARRLEMGVMPLVSALARYRVFDALPVARGVSCRTT